MSTLKTKNSLENTILRKLKLTEYGNIEKIMQPIKNTIENHWKISETIFTNKKDGKYNINKNLSTQNSFLNIKNFNEDGLISKKIFNNTAKTNLTTQANSFTSPTFFNTKISKSSEKNTSGFYKKKIKISTFNENKVLMQKLFQTYENNQINPNDSNKNIIYYNFQNLKDTQIIMDTLSPKNQEQIEKPKKSLMKLKSLKIPNKLLFSDSEIKYIKDTCTPKNYFKNKSDLINVTFSNENEENDKKKNIEKLSNKYEDEDIKENYERSSVKMTNSNKNIRFPSNYTMIEKSNSKKSGFSRSLEKNYNIKSINTSPILIEKCYSLVSVEEFRLSGKKKVNKKETNNIIKNKKIVNDFKPKLSIPFNTKEFNLIETKTSFNRLFSQKICSSRKNKFKMIDVEQNFRVSKFKN